jgi:hypothetical protein
VACHSSRVMTRQQLAGVTAADDRIVVIHSAPAKLP